MDQEYFAVRVDVDMWKKHKKIIAIIAVACSLLLLTLIFSQSVVRGYIKYMFYPKNELKINLQLVNPNVKMLAADPSNTLVMQVEVRDKMGDPVSQAPVRLSVTEGTGKLYPSQARTDAYGRCLVTYIPPSYDYNEYKGNNKNVTINANLAGTAAKSSVSIALTRIPVIFIHGYQAGVYVFDSMREYLSAKGFEGGAFGYKSENGVIQAANELNSFLGQQKVYFLSKGIQVSKFDIIAHSMGGLVARYYTCSQDYVIKNDVRKIIFLSTPHRGSHWATLGLGYFNDQGIRDLVPENDLLVKVFPSLINKGLNNSIQVGSIAGQYDEVVSPESSSLDEWNIKTEIFNVGEKSLTMDNLLSGKIAEAPNHQTIVYNKKVFEKIESMLNSDLPYPAVKK